MKTLIYILLCEKNMLWQQRKKIQNEKNPIKILDMQQFPQYYSQ